MTELLLGDEAVAAAAIDAGVRGAFSYPGTPATEIFETIAREATREPGVAARWSANEKVAYEEALGMSFIGHRALVSMKHVGLNVASDPFMSSALTGVVGGLVLVVADDPGMHSSQNEQDTRYYAEFAQLPLWEPSSQQEAYDMTREAFDFSERVGLPAIVRLVTRLSHSRAEVMRFAPDTRVNQAHRRGDPRNWTLLPVNARRQYRRLLDLQPKLREYSEGAPHNQLSIRGSTGILTSGIAYNYVREVLPSDSHFSLLKINTYPVPLAKLRQLVDHCFEIFVIEEGYPFLEDRLRGFLGVPGKSILGKRSGDLPRDGELTAEIVAAALQRQPAEGAVSRPSELPVRPPVLCQGCPHCDTFRALVQALDKETQPILFSDIGCYTLGAMPPYNAVHTCVDMGASISMALGAAKGGAHPVVCTIGDSTFTHSGMAPLLGAAAEDANITVIILDNATVAMTGGQEVLATAERLAGIIRGLGVPERHIVPMEPLPKYHDRNTSLIRSEIEHRGLSVVISSRPCVQITRRRVRSHTSHMPPEPKIVTTG